MKTVGNPPTEKLVVGIYLMGLLKEFDPIFFKLRDNVSENTTLESVISETENWVGGLGIEHSSPWSEEMTGSTSQHCCHNPPSQVLLQSQVPQILLQSQVPQTLTQYQTRKKSADTFEIRASATTVTNVGKNMSGLHTSKIIHKLSAVHAKLKDTVKIMEAVPRSYNDKRHDSIATLPIMLKPQC
jgi:hypothetical protein